MKPARLQRLRRFLGALAEERFARPGAHPFHPARELAHPRDREFAAFLIAMLRTGHGDGDATCACVLLNRLGRQPALTLVKANRQMLDDLCSDLSLSFLGPQALSLWLAALRNSLRRHRSLGDLFLHCLGPDGKRPLLVALDRFVVELEKGTDEEELRAHRLGHLFPRPAKGSATARLHLFLRAVCRPDDGLDLGLWPKPLPGNLLLPMDQAVLDRLVWLKLSEREKPSRGAVLEATQQLRMLNHLDPVFFHHSLEQLISLDLDVEAMRQRFRHA
jgi:uncharacterized protein (TIGR02757 family)